ncbi:hypothetical protein RI367_003167 [Sorochytrium milnesiophthora]
MPPSSVPRILLSALLDTIVQPVPVAALLESLHQGDESRLSQLAAVKGTDVVSPDELWTALHTRLTPYLFTKVHMGLRAMDSKIGMAVLTNGRFLRAFPDLDPEERIAMLLSLTNASIDSPLVAKKSLFKVITAIVCVLCYGSPKLHDLVGEATGYTTHDPERDNKAAFDYPYNFIKVSEDKAELETDVVVVGSGAGGGVAAAILAQSGKRVLVLERGKHYRADELHGSESKALELLYDNGALTTPEEGNLNILAGATFGGGTAVNWCASLRPPDAVRAEWATKFGLKHFASPEFTATLDKVCARLGVSTDNIEHSAANSLLLSGCEKLGYPAATIPQNTANRKHNCGWCPFGCKAGDKQSSAVTYLVDANEAGAMFIDQCFVNTVTHKKGVVTGVQATVAGKYRLTVKAPIVVVACGSLYSPALLQRSGLKNRNIGRNLRVHPALCAWGYFPDRKIDAFSSSIMTAVSTVAEDLDGHHYGAKIEVPSAHLGAYQVLQGWRSPTQSKTAAARIGSMCPLLVLVRDRDSKASVETNSAKDPVLHFEMSEFDRHSATEGLAKALDVLVTSGASEVHTAQRHLPPFKPKSTDVKDPEYQAYLAQLRKIGVDPQTTAIACAHQMGSCRMGNSPKTSAVNPDGETWEVKNLFVADASLFPTASGVNPMITTYAMGHTVADRIVQRERSGLHQQQPPSKL